MDNFEDIKELVLHYARGVWKYRWIAILVAWPVLLTGVIFVDQLKDRYEAETKVYIDTTSVLRPLLKGIAVETDFQSNVRLMVRKLLSRPNLERAIRLMDMDIDTKSDREFDALIEKVKSRVDISGKYRSGVYTITYQDELPQRAKKMVQTLLDIFVEDTLGQSAKESDSAISFLDKQISKYDLLLQEAEQRMENFKRDNVGVMPKDGANFFKQLQDITALLEQSSLELTELINRRNQFKVQLDQLTFKEAIETTSSKYDGHISKYDGRISSLEDKLEDLLLTYTDVHPEVMNTKLIIESLRKKREEELSNREKELSNLSTNLQSSKLDNPVYQQLQILLSETEANIASLSARVNNYKNKKIQLKKFVDIVPKIESELNRLNRDYGVHKKNYNSLVSRREQAKISEDVESGTEQVKFRVIEPPRVPNVASFPNRPLFDAGILIISLGIGYGIGLLISLVRPVFYNIKDLRDYTGLAVLGAVSKFDTDAVLRKRKRNIYLFVLANAMLLLVAAVVISLHSQHVLILSELQLKIMSMI